MKYNVNRPAWQGGPTIPAAYEHPLGQNSPLFLELNRRRRSDRRWICAIAAMVVAAFVWVVM